MSDLEALATTIATADSVVTIGAATQQGIGGAIDPGATEVRVPAGIVSYEPADMTVTLLAGTSVAVLDATLAEHGQECPLDPRSMSATVGGVFASGQSGPRRLRYGPLRDRILEVRFLTGDGRIVKGGGPTVKNVTGYDLPRLFVGSLGTLGVITQVTLRTQPRAECSQWAQTDAHPDALRDLLFRPATLAWDGRKTFVRLEGYAEDVAAEQQHAHLAPLAEPPNWPAGAHRGRISIAPARLGALAPALDELDGAWLAEGHVGTVHVATTTEEGLAAARTAAERAGGWLLREEGAPGLDPFGRSPANLPLLARIKDGFDPTGKLNPGRLPFLRRAA